MEYVELPFRNWTLGTGLMMVMGNLFEPIEVGLEISDIFWAGALEELLFTDQQKDAVFVGLEICHMFVSHDTVSTCINVTYQQAISSNFYI